MYRNFKILIDGKRACVIAPDTKSPREVAYEVKQRFGDRARPAPPENGNACEKKADAEKVPVLPAE